MRLKAGGVVFAIVAFALIARSASAATTGPVSTQVAPPIAALQDAASGLMAGAEQILASIEAALGGIATILGRNPASVGQAGSSLSYTAAADISQSPAQEPTATVADQSPSDPALPPVVEAANQPVVEAVSSANDTVTAGELSNLLTEFAHLLALLPSTATSTGTPLSDDQANPDFTTTQQEIAALQHEVAQTNQINTLSNVTLISPTVVDGSLGGGSSSGGAGSFDSLSVSGASSLSVATAASLGVTGTSTLAGLNLVSTNCSTYGNGGKLTTDAFGNVICAADQGGSGSTVGGADSQVQFNSGGSFAGSAGFTFSSSTEKLTVPNASTTDLSVSGNSILGSATSTSLFSTIAEFTTAIANTLNASVANIIGFTATNATTTNLGIDGSTFNDLLGTGLSDTGGALTVSLAPFSTSNLAEGSNLYFTGNRVASVIAGTTTDALAQGTTNKYFSNALAQNALSVSGLPLTYSGGVIGINQASGSQPGFLASADWTNFNGKLASTSLSAGTGISYNSSTGVIGNTGVTSVGASGGSTGLTFTGSPVTTTGTLSLGGLLGIGFGGTGTSTAPSYGQLLLGNGNGGYSLTSTSSLGILSGGGTWGSITGTLTNQTDLQAALNGKLASTSLATSALLAGLISDETGSGSLVFATSPTFAGTPVFSGGLINDSADSTTTVPNGTPYAWTVATSSSANPLIEVDTSGSTGAVSIGSESASSTTVEFGVTGEPANLVFAASSTIEGAGTGQQITIGANSDVVDFGVNVGIGTTTPGSIFSINGVGNWTGATSTLYSTGGINITSGCFSIDGACIGGSGGGTSYTFSYPLLNTANTISLAFGTTTANSWSQLQTFTNLTASGTGTFATASTTNLVVSGIGNGGTQCLQVNALGQITGTGSGCGGSGSTPGGSNGQVQFNGSGSFGGASNLFWNSGSNSLGVGTAAPAAELSVATPVADNTTGTAQSPLFSVASSTATATTTLFSIDSAGDVVSTLAASSTFAVGANGLTNPAFQIFASTTNAANGLALITTLAGGGVSLNTISSGANESLTVQSKGSGNLNLAAASGAVDFVVGATARGSVAATKWTFSPSNTTSNANPNFLFTLPADTGQVANGEANLVQFNDSAVVTHSNDTGGLNIPFDRNFLINAPTENFTTFSTGNNIGTAATFAITGAPINSATSNGTTTNAVGILIGASATTASTTNSYGLEVNANTGARNNYAAEFLGGNVGIGSTTPQATLEVWGPDTASTSAFTVSNSASTTEFTVYDTGNATLAGSLVQNSDQRLKTNVQPLDASSSLAEIDALDPVTFNWIDPAKSSVPQFGFIAQQVQHVFSNLVSTTSPTALTPDGTLSLNYIDLISPIVSAIQELEQELTSLASTVAGFAQSVTTDVLNATTVNAHQLCLDGTCVTATQLAALLASANRSSGPPASPPPPVSGTADTPPVVQINGDNPAIIQVGASYTDLGAAITGPEADLNLGISTYVNGVQTSPVEIDTSQVATDTIDYVVADATRNTSTSTRTVIIRAPAASPPAPEPTASTTDDSATTTSAAQ